MIRCIVIEDEPLALKQMVSYIDFLQAANKANTAVKQKEDEFLLIKSEYKIIRINFSDILYIEGMREYIRIHLENSKPVMTLLSMKSIEQKLPSARFMRVHRSYVVNLEKITTIERNRIVFDKEAFQKFIDGNFLA